MVDDDAIEGRSEKRFTYDIKGQVKLIKYYDDNETLGRTDSLLWDDEKMDTLFTIDQKGDLYEKIKYAYIGNNVQQIALIRADASIPYRTLTYQYNTGLKDLSMDFATLFALYQVGDYLVPQLFSKNARTTRLDLTDGTVTDRDTISYTGNAQGYPASYATSLGSVDVFYMNCD